MALFGLVKMGEEGVTISFKEFLGNKYAMLGVGVAGGMLGAAIIPTHVTNTLNLTGKAAIATRFITNLTLSAITYALGTRIPEEGYGFALKYSLIGASLGFIGFGILDTVQELMKRTETGRKVLMKMYGVPTTPVVVQSPKPQTSGVIEVPATEAYTEAEVIEVPVEQEQPNLNIGFNIE